MIYVGGILAFEWWKVDVPAEVEELEELTGIEIDDSGHRRRCPRDRRSRVPDDAAVRGARHWLSDEVPDLKEPSATTSNRFDGGKID